MTTTTHQPCPSCDGKGYIMHWNQYTSRTIRLRCEHCLQTGSIITANAIMRCMLQEYPGCVFYFGKQWALYDLSGLVASHTCNFVTAWYENIADGCALSLQEHAWARRVQEEIDAAVTQGLGEPVTTGDGRAGACARACARAFGWPVDARA